MLALMSLFNKTTVNLETLKMTNMGAREMAQWLEALTAPMMGNLKPPVTPAPGSLVPSSGLSEYFTHMQMHTHN